LNIQANGEEKISVTLTKTDMTDFHITYDELDYSNIETRRIIWTILDEAKKTLGKAVNIDNRLLIQVSPAEDGGCFFEFTQLPEVADTKKRRLIMKKEAEPVLFCAFDENAFLDCFDFIKTEDKSIKEYSLHLYDGEYFALIHPKISETEKLLFSLCEFGEAAVSPKEQIAEILEFGRKLS
jgi:negative regulator of genetic competence, sporulation and motility